MSWILRYGVLFFHGNGNRIVDCKLRVIPILLIRSHPQESVCVPFPAILFQRAHHLD